VTPPKKESPANKKSNVGKNSSIRLALVAATAFFGWVGWPYLFPEKKEQEAKPPAQVAALTKAPALQNGSGNAVQGYPC
jgi:hypothetical protein